jgi:hypothetical protein
LTLNSSTGEIAGTPSATGQFSFTAQADDAVSSTTTKSFSVTVFDPLVISTSSLPSGMVSTAYSQTVTAAGGQTPYTWSVISGMLPVGLTLDSATGVISGTPRVAATVSFTLRASAINGATDTKALSISVYSLLNITTSSLSAATVGSAYSQTVTAAGGQTPYTWSVTSGSLPSGLTLNGSTGVISGTPSGAGAFSFTVQVNDANATTATKALSISVNNNLAVRVTGAPMTYYPTLQAAYNAAAAGNTIQSQALVFSENLNLNRAVAVILRGGFDSGFTSNAGYSIISGSLTISNGTVTVENIVIQ